MKKKRSPTIRTVAKEAGVSVATVSRALNEGRVSADLSRKVKEAVRALGFVPHPAARSLAKHQVNTIGLVVNSTRGSWFSELIAGVEEALRPSRRSVVIGTLRLTAEYDASAIYAWLEERRVDGILFVRCSEREAPLLEAAQAHGVPVILIAPDVQVNEVLAVHAKNANGGELAARHLLDLGHRHIAFIGGPEDSRDTQDRLRGFRKVLHQSGVISPGPTWFASNYYSDGGREVVDKFLALDSRPSAVVCASDALALGFARGILERGLRIPDDVSLVGFDDSPEAELFWPGLTSVAQPSREMARTACAALIASIDAKPIALKNEFELSLSVRHSTRAIAPPLLK